MKTSSSFQAGTRAALLLLALAVPLTTATAEDKKRTPRKAQERPALASKMGNFFFGATRKLERSMDANANANDRSKSRTVKYTASAATPPTGMMTANTNVMASTSASATGLPGKLTLTPRSGAAPAGSTVIYVAPDRTQPNGGTLYLNEDPTVDELMQQQAALNASTGTTMQSAPTPTPTVAPKPLPPLDRSKLPTAQRGETMSRVVSPYPPHNQLDVTGLPSGSLARDPSVGKVFIVP